MAAFDEYSHPVSDENRKWVYEVLVAYANLTAQIADLDVLDLVKVLHEVSGGNGPVGTSRLWSHPQAVALLKVAAASPLPLINDALHDIAWTT